MSLSIATNHHSTDAFILRSPDIIGRLRATDAFKSSRNGQPNHVIVNEVNILYDMLQCVSGSLTLSEVPSRPRNNGMKHILKI